MAKSFMELAKELAPAMRGTGPPRTQRVVLYMRDRTFETTVDIPPLTEESHQAFMARVRARGALAQARYEQRVAAAATPVHGSLVADTMTTDARKVASDEQAQDAVMHGSGALGASPALSDMSQ